jgi:hypothetical protein
MAYVPDAACIAAARAAAGDDLAQADIMAAFQRVDEFKQKLISEGKAVGADARLRRFAQEEAQRTQIAAAVARRHAALNIIIRDKQMETIGHMVNAGLTPRQAMLAILEGSTKGVQNARKSVQALRQSYEAVYVGGLLSEIARDRPHLAYALDDKVLDADVLKELRELRSDEFVGPTKSGITGNSDALYLAKAFAKYAELMRVDLNRLGANIGKLEGWGGVQMHDPVKMMKIAPEEWAARIMPYLDIERTFPDGLSSREALDTLASIYNTIITGVPATPRPGERGQRTGPANMAKSLGHNRVLHFRDADAALAYRDEFGYGNTIDGMKAHLLNGARVAANMKALGPNPEAMFISISEELQRRVRESKTISPADKAKMVEGLKTDTGAMRHALDIAVGTQAIPGSLKWAEIGSSVRILQSTAKLGGALISSIQDPVSVAASAQFRGSSFFSTFGRQLGMMLSGRPKGEAAEISFLIGEGFDGWLGKIGTAFGALDGPVGAMGKLQELFFRMNGLTWWTDVQRSGAGRIISAEMGMRSQTAFRSLPDAYKHVLGLHGIGENKWSIIRKANLRQVNGVDYVTPDRIREVDLEEFAPIMKKRIDAARKALRVDDAKSPAVRAAREARFQERRTALLEEGRRELELDLLGFIADETNYGIIETDARSRRTSTWGTRPGTLAGEAMRFIMQFKGWPIAFTQRTIGRNFFARRRGSWDVNNPIFWSETMPHIGTLIAGMTLAGYGAMTIKDTLKGYGPRDPADPRTWMAAMQQGGAWGIYGDFLFSTNNRFGGGLAETLLGPTIGTVGDLWNITADARDAALTGGEDTFSTAKAFSSLWANVPGANLFYAKPVLDTLFLNSLRETLSPGYLRRQDRMRLREDGHERLFPATL